MEKEIEIDALTDQVKYLKLMIEWMVEAHGDSVTTDYTADSKPWKLKEYVEESMVEFEEMEKENANNHSAATARKSHDIIGSFRIITSPEVAEKIRKQFEFDKTLGGRDTLRLGEIITRKGLVSDYSIVHIFANTKIDPSAIFFLGLFSAGQ